MTLEQEAMNKHSMNRRTFLTTAAIAGASTLVLPRVSGIALAAEPTLEETLAWLQGKFVEFGDDAEHDRKYSIRITEYDAVAGTMLTTVVGTYREGNSWREDYHTTYQVRLADLTPQVDYLNGHFWHIILRSTDEKLVISKALTLKDKRARESLVAHVAFHVRASAGSDLLPRVVKAFSHAIKLAGGQPSGRKPNEPF